MKSNYVLITAARNEQDFIEDTIKSVISQKILPKNWIIVSDGSSDQTDDIVKEYAKDNVFIKFLRLENNTKRNFRSQVYAINAGYDELKDIDYNFIGNIDADISFEKEYFSSLLKIFDKNKKLGLTGGTIYERYRGIFRRRPFNSSFSVPHAVQFFRRECFEQIGGYLPLKYGGPDTHAEVMVRMKGWITCVYPELPVYHNRATSSIEGFIKAAFRQGKIDYSIGNHPLFEFVKLTSRVREKPFFLFTFARMIGFIAGLNEKDKRIVTEEFVSYLRKEQLNRIRHVILRGSNNSVHKVRKIFGDLF